MLPTTVLLVCDASVPNSKRWMLRDLESAVDVRDAIGYTVADCVERVAALQEATIPALDGSLRAACTRWAPLSIRVGFLQSATSPGPRGGSSEHTHRGRGEALAAVGPKNGRARERQAAAERKRLTGAVNN